MDKIWEEIHGNSAWGSYPPEHVIRFVARNYYKMDRHQIKILDFGCGQGANTWYLAREGFNTYAFDGSFNAVKKCEDKLRKEGLKAELIVSEGVSVEYPNDFFDAVIDNACIYANRINDIRIMYQKIFLMIKKGGKILTVCFGEDLDGYLSGEEIEPGTYNNIKDGVLANRGLTHIFQEKDLIQLLQDIGFVVEQSDWVRYLDFGNKVHQIMIIARKV